MCGKFTTIFSSFILKGNYGKSGFIDYNYGWLVGIIFKPWITSCIIQYKGFQNMYSLVNS